MFDWLEKMLTCAIMSPTDVSLCHNYEAELE